MAIHALTHPDAVVTIQCRSVGDNDLIAFFKAVEYLYLADGVAPEFNRPALRFGSVRTQHKHTNGLLCLPESRPADFQHIFKALELDGSVHAQVRTRARRQRPDQ